jgi:hypothetical protein
LHYSTLLPTVKTRLRKSRIKIAAPLLTTQATS